MKSTFKKMIRAFMTLTCSMVILSSCGEQTASSISSVAQSDEQSTEQQQEEFITKAIEQSNPRAEVHVGEYESILTGDVQDVDPESQTLASSTMFDVKKDDAIHVVYNEESRTNLMAVSSLLNNIVMANEQLQTITIKDRGGNYSTNNLSTNGTFISVSMPGGFEYGEVYQIAINDAPYLRFENKGATIRTLTIEIEDDPNEATTYDEKQLKGNSINIDRSKITNQRENEQSELYSFDYEGNLPTLNKGDVFYATDYQNPNDKLDFYGVFQKAVNTKDNIYHVEYSAPKMEDIYERLRLKGQQPLDLKDSELLLTDSIAAQQFKESNITRAMLKTLYPHFQNDILSASNLLDNFKIRFDINMVNNRLSLKFSAGIFNYKLKDKLFLSIDLGYEKQTDYSVDFDVSIRTKWVFPVGVDYKIKCIEETSEQVYIRANLTAALAPETPPSDKDFVDDICGEIENMEKGGHNVLYPYKDDQEFKGSTSGTKTSWPLLQIDIYYFEPISIQFKFEFYIDAGFQVMGIGKKETHSTKVNFNFTNMGGTGTDAYNKVTKTSNWMLYLTGSAHIEFGFKASLSFSILGLHKYLHAVAFGEFYINISFTGTLALDISTTEVGTAFTGYIGIDFAVTVGMRVGLDFKLLFVESNINKILWFEYLFRINYENALEHWSTLSESEIDMNEQTMSIDKTSILFISYFDSVTQSLREKKYDANAKFSIFSGCLCPQAFIDGTGGHIFTYTPGDDKLLEIDEDGNIHVKDGTEASFTTYFTVSVSNWAGTIEDKTVILHYTANDTKEVYVDNKLIGNYRPGYQFTLPEGPEVYGKEFISFFYDGKSYQPGDKITMTDKTLYIRGIYRDLEYFTVTFFDGFFNIVAEEIVMEGDPAPLPSRTLRDRYMNDEYHFLGWNVDLSCIKKDTIALGIYMRITEE